ncbi:MAG TPA: L-selenocysteinyl-tRNA(Sec) synthase, partial [Ktedonobacteraceae bacterium]|nr:L-selenocysteinyl-tRNA(Sec) synthase [Ktedonobacteraceae bacterium]
MTFDRQQLRLLPSVDDLLQSPTGQDLAARFSFALAKRAVRDCLAQARASIRDGASCPSTADLLKTAQILLQEEQQPHLRSLINATGVIINTNLGRAPLCQEALQAVQAVSYGYSNLEYELTTGERGSRHSHVVQLLRELTGAED